jgi:LuxR family maltose regulon positive regulatory protein
MCALLVGFQAALQRNARQSDSYTRSLLAYVNQLLAAFPETRPLVSSNPPILSRGTALLEPLTKRELQVLHLIAQGATNQEIARELAITVSTVKKHVGLIFAKLGVTHRTEAVARSRELGLI